MHEWIYCGTEPPVDVAGTQTLLREMQAIWCPPPGLRAWPGIPEIGSHIWLVWRADPGAEVFALGRGEILRAPRELFGTGVLWTGRDDVRLRDLAVSLGYGGGAAMCFLRVGNPWLVEEPGVPVPGLEEVANRLNRATDIQSDALREACGTV
jgi:hypothetical protein